MTVKYNHINEFGLCEGDVSYINLGTVNNGSITPVILKISKNERDNDLLINESNILKDLNVKIVAEPKSGSYKFCVPTLIESFQVNSSNGNPRPYVNVIEYYPGFFDIESIRKITTGVDGRTLVWMYKRLLGVLSWIHHFRYVHGAVLPPHVMYFPDSTTTKDERTHSVRLVDWSYAVNYEKEHKLKAWLPDYEDFYAPEVLEKKNLGPHSDLYMAAKTMIYLSGGDVKNNKFASRIPLQISKQIGKCLEPNYRKRPQNVTDIFQQFVSTAKDVYGSPKFHEFKLIK